MEAGAGPKQPECPPAGLQREGAELEGQRRAWRQDSLSLVQWPILVTLALPEPLLASI